MKIVALMLALASPSLSYPQVKAAVFAVRAQAPAAPIAVFRGQYDVMDCGGSEYVGNTTTKASAYAYIADKVLIWERDLPRLGYPRSVWEGPVARFESSSLYIANTVDPARFYEASGDVMDARRKGLEDALLAYRKTHPRAAVIANGLGCGGGEVPVTLVTRPVATQVTIIPSFFYELCRVQRIDPNDTSRCAHWREVSGPIVQVSGTIATSRGGTTARSNAGSSMSSLLRTPARSHFASHSWRRS